MIKIKIDCPICGEGIATLKYADNLYFYECDKCMSEFANNDVCKINHSISDCCNHDCQQGRYCPNRKQSSDDSIVAYIVLIFITLIVFSIIFGIK